jgi:two-component system, sensor kinase
MGSRVRSSQEQDKSMPQLWKEVAILRRQVAALQAFKRNLVEMQDRQRRSIALEVSDELAQLATGAMMHFDTYKALHEHDPTAAQDCFELGLQLLAEGIRVARRIVNRLVPASLGDVGVMAAVTDLVQQCRADGPTAIELVGSDHWGRLPPPLENAVFRIVQESLANACAHSRSQKVRIVLNREGDRLRIEVRDWGVGFDPENLPAGRFGVESIRDRAIAFGGQAIIESRRGEGTSVVVELPLPPTSPSSGSTAGRRRIDPPPAAS